MLALLLHCYCTIATAAAAAGDQLNPSIRCIVLYGANGTFCAGADLSAVAAGAVEKMNPLEEIAVAAETNADIDAGWLQQRRLQSASAASVSEGWSPPSPYPSDPASSSYREWLSSLPTHLRHIGPMGCSRLLLTKPTIAAVEDAAVAGGLELACWCDLRVLSESAKMGVLCRRVGVPLIDGGTGKRAIDATEDEGITAVACKSDSAIGLRCRASH